MTGSRKIKHTASHWSNYWQAGQLTSLPQDFKENYNGEIHHEWNACFQRLSEKNSLLDLCAGNCAISLLAVEYAKLNNLELSVSALDFADISKINIIKKCPNHEANLKEITLYSNCLVEDTGLNENSFNLITSQYGIEYCDWESSAKEVYRLLKTGGEFVMISHSGSTEIVKYMKIEKSDYQSLFEVGLFKSLLRFSNNKISHRELMTKLKIIQSKIVKKYKQQSTQLLESILIMLDRMYTMPKSTMVASKYEILILCKQHRFAFERLTDLLRVIELILKNPKWYEVFEKNGLKLMEKREIFQDNKNNSGHLYRFIKT